MLACMKTTDPHIGKGMVETALDDTISEEEMDRRLAVDGDEVNALLREAYDELARGECAPLEPLHVLRQEPREQARRAR
jgi:hypothetical protein